MCGKPKPYNNACTSVYVTISRLTENIHSINSDNGLTPQFTATRSRLQRDAFLFPPLLCEGLVHLTLNIGNMSVVCRALQQQVCTNSSRVESGPKR